jgi:hypothetical protein
MTSWDLETYDFLQTFISVLHNDITTLEPRWEDWQWTISKSGKFLMDFFKYPIVAYKFGNQSCHHNVASSFRFFNIFIERTW